MEIILFLLIGVIAGWLAEKIMKREHGLLTNLIVGAVGAFIGGFISRSLGWDTGGGFIASIVVATLGAVLLLFVLGMIRRAR